MGTMVGCDVMPRGNDTPVDCVDKCTEWDIRDQFETIDGMPVYHGGDLCDSDELDWDDPYDIASANMWSSIILTSRREWN